MLAITFGPEGYVFVFHRGLPIGAVQRAHAGRGVKGGRVTLCFAGSERDFRVLRPEIVAREFGEQELRRLMHCFGIVTRTARKR